MRVRRRAKVRREGFTETPRAFLLSGRPWFLNDEGYGHRLDVDSAQRDWAEHRDDLLDHWLQNPQACRLRHHEDRLHPAPGGPGTRPWGWWAFDGPRELRRLVAGDVPWLPITDWSRETSFGQPKYFEREPASMQWEAEDLFLARHGLLSPAEQRARRIPEVAGRSGAPTAPRPPTLVDSVKHRPADAPENGSGCECRLD